VKGNGGGGCRRRISANKLAREEARVKLHCGVAGRVGEKKGQGEVVCGEGGLGEGVGRLKEGMEGLRRGVEKGVGRRVSGGKRGSH